MSRHRNLRTISYSDDYDEDDDGQYGEDEDLSPSEAEFVYDRYSHHPTVSSFINGCRENKKSHEASEEDEVYDAKLKSCLQELQNNISDILPEPELINIVLAHNFDVHLALDDALHRISNEASRYEKCNKRSTLDIEEGSSSDVSNSNVMSGSDKGSTPTSPVRNVIQQKKSGVVTSSVELTVERSDSPRTTDSDANIVSRSMKDVSELYKKERKDSKPNLYVVVIGHVDAGKSTIMGHLLYKLGYVNKKVLHKYEQESKNLGKQSFLYAWVLDETEEERNRGITMDIGQTMFEVGGKNVILLDAPGHKDFIPNMITGATQADVALLILDATVGEFETGFESGGQTREHSLLVRSLGISQLGVVVNKMDNVSWSQARFHEICKKVSGFLQKAGFKDTDFFFIPCSGLLGENLSDPPTEPKLKEWYTGPTLFDSIGNFTCPERSIKKPFRMSVNDIFKGTGSGFCVSGRVDSGVVQTGDKILVQPEGKLASIKALSMSDRNEHVVFAGDYVCMTVGNYDMQNIMVGYVLCDMLCPVPVTSKFEARIVVFNILSPIVFGFQVLLHMQSLVESAVITKLTAMLNKSTGEITKKNPRLLSKNTTAIIEIETSRPVCVELYKNVKELGRLVLRSAGVTVAAGLVTKIY